MANPFLQALLGGQIGPQRPPWMTPGINPNAPMPFPQPRGMPGRPGSVSLPPPMPGQAPASGGGQGPAWLQKLAGGANRLMTGLSSPMASSLLQAAAPTPVGTSSPLAGVGAAMQNAQQMQAGLNENEMRRRLIEAQIAKLQAPTDDRAEPSAIREMRTLGYPLTAEGFKQYNNDQAKQGTTINIGEKLNEPIPIAQLDTVRLPNGQTPPIGTTFAEARAMGAQVLSAEDQKRTIQADQALGILNQLEAIAIGPEGVFNEVQPGLANRAASAIDFGLDMLTQNDPRASQFHDMSQATLAPFIKFLGETGSLATGDVQRAIGLLPRIFPLPDTGEVARDKISELREIITRGVRNMNSVSRQSEDIPPPPPGFTLDPE